MTCMIGSVSCQHLQPIDSCGGVIRRFLLEGPSYCLLGWEAMISGNHLSHIVVAAYFLAVGADLLALTFSPQLGTALEGCEPGQTSEVPHDRAQEKCSDNILSP